MKATVSCCGPVKYRGVVAAMIRDMLAMQHELAIDRPLSPLVSVARLRAQHAAISADFQNLKTLRQSYGDLPIPPVPGVKDRRELAVNHPPAGGKHRSAHLSPAGRALAIHRIEQNPECPA